MQTNNKLRDALTKILNLTNSLDEDCAVDPVEIRDIAKAALAETVKNYEVGTPEELAERLHLYCIRQDCATCPCNVGKADGRCEFVWLQMPYVEKEGGAK